MYYDDIRKVIRFDELLVHGCSNNQELMNVLFDYEQHRFITIDATVAPKD
jgi:hypothetical protein